MATSADLQRAMLSLHADMHFEAAAIHELINAGVGARTIKALYPLDASSWNGSLARHFQSEHVRERFFGTMESRFEQLALEGADSDPRRWISKMTAAHGNALHAIYEPMSRSVEAEALLDVITPSDDWKPRQKARMRIQAIYARMTIADNWSMLEEHHGFESKFLTTLSGIRYALSF